MERLKSSIPQNLMALILSTPASDLSISTAALSKHFSTTPHFFQLLEQLKNPNLTTCAKDAEGAANWKRDGNAAFGRQDYDKALSCYTKALRFAPIDSKEEDSRVAQAVLFVNRAATLHDISEATLGIVEIRIQETFPNLYSHLEALYKNLGLLEPASRDCDRAIDSHPLYFKAWYRRGLVKFDMNDYSGAVIDMKNALARENASGSRLQIRRELAQMESKLKSEYGAESRQNHSLSSSPGVPRKMSTHQQMEGINSLQKHWTEENGWSLRTKEDLQSGSLAFQEDPYAAVVLKSARDTHCHFCFEILPEDPVPCRGCSIPLYCSELCRETATGSLVGVDSKKTHMRSQLSPTDLTPDDLLANSSTQVVRAGSFKHKLQENLEGRFRRWGEHVPECGGASWSAVLPTDAVLGARMLFRSGFVDIGLPRRTLNLLKGAGEFEVDTLCHHYDRLNANDKLELHVLGIVLAHCVNQSTEPSLENGPIAAVSSKVIGLMAQARVNAMAIYGMSSPEIGEDVKNRNMKNSKTGNGINPNLTNIPLCTVEQIKVAQGVFLIGSRLNHSCVPNIHASFIAGRLFVRAVTNIPQCSTLELCYGPQVGELNQLERKQLLLDRYFFSCTCPGCSKLTLPDLCLRAFKCIKAGCRGIVLGPDSLESKYGQIGDSNSRTFSDIGEQERLEVSIPLGEKAIKQNRQQSTVAIDANLIDSAYSKASLVGTENVGCCLFCRSVLGIETVSEVGKNASAHLESVEADLLKGASDGRDVKDKLKGALNALKRLVATLHPYNQQLAKGEDIVARLMCAVDQPLEALQHCKRSIKILEHLYNEQHIIVGNEYIKLASIALMASDVQCASQSLAIVDNIFRIHYGSDYGSRLSYVVRLRQFIEERLQFNLLF